MQIKQILLLNPGNFPLVIGIANCFLVQGYILKQKAKTEEANQLFSKALYFFESEYHTNGCTHSMAALAFMYERGLGTEIDHDKAVAFYERAAAANNTVAIILLARKYHFGNGVAIDNDKSNDLLNQAYKMGIAATNPIFQKIQARKDQMNVWILSTAERLLSENNDEQALATLKQLRNTDGLSVEQIYRIGRLFAFHFHYEQTARFFLNQAYHAGFAKAGITLEVLDNLPDQDNDPSDDLENLIDAVIALRKLLKTASCIELSELIGQIPYALRFHATHNDSTVCDDLANQFNAYMNADSNQDDTHKELMMAFVSLLKNPAGYNENIIQLIQAEYATTINSIKLCLREMRLLVGAELRNQSSNLLTLVKKDHLNNLKEIQKILHSQTLNDVDIMKELLPILQRNDIDKTFLEKMMAIIAGSNNPHKESFDNQTTLAHCSLWQSTNTEVSTSAVELEMHEIKDTNKQRRKGV